MGESPKDYWFCPCVPVYKGISIVFSLFRIHWLCVAYCLVSCIGSCVPVHDDRPNIFCYPSGIKGMEYRESYLKRLLPSRHNLVISETTWQTSEYLFVQYFEISLTSKLQGYVFYRGLIVLQVVQIWGCG